MKMPRSNKLQPVPSDLSLALGTALTSQRERTLNALSELEDLEARTAKARRVAEDRYATYEAMLAEVDGQLKFDLSEMSWTCMVCGEERFNQYIRVAHRPISGAEHLFPQGRVNVRYCNDREHCSTTANARGPWRWPSP